MTEQVEAFTTDSSGYTTDTVEHDSAGNLTYDGSQAYTYDAWNRMISVAHAYKDSSGTLHAGQVFQLNSYDTKSRRVIKAVSSTGQHDCTYHYYYDGQRKIEAHDGSDNFLNQQVWGVQYVDELLQVATSRFAGTHTSYAADTSMWVCQDANHNVLGIVDSDGNLQERYQYSPYGERTVYSTAGENDPILSVSSSSAPRVVGVDMPDRPFGYCEFGHQGLMHDEESELVYNRARILSPLLGRFLQRDAKYFDGENLYEYTRSNPVNRNDAFGRQSDCPCCCTGSGPSITTPWQTFPERQSTRVGFNITTVFTVKGDHNKCTFHEIETGTLSWTDLGGVNKVQGLNPQPIEGKDNTIPDGPGGYIKWVGNSGTFLDPAGYPIPRNIIGVKLKIKLSDNYSVKEQCFNADKTLGWESKKIPLHGSVIVTVNNSKDGPELTENSLIEGQPSR